MRDRRASGRPGQRDWRFQPGVRRAVPPPTEYTFDVGADWCALVVRAEDVEFVPDVDTVTMDVSFDEGLRIEGEDSVFVIDGEDAMMVVPSLEHVTSVGHGAFDLVVDAAPTDFEVTLENGVVKPQEPRGKTPVRKAR